MSEDNPSFVIALYRLHRIGKVTDAHDELDERNFVKPTEWIPERYTTQPELILDKSAFVPWNIGELHEASLIPSNHEGDEWERALIVSFRKICLHWEEPELDGNPCCRRSHTINI